MFWPREFYRLYSSWGCKELDTTEWLSLSLFMNICICVYCIFICILLICICVYCVFICVIYYLCLFVLFVCMLYMCILYICICVSWYTYARVSFGYVYITKEGIADMGFFKCIRQCQTVFQSGYQFIPPPTVYESYRCSWRHYIYYCWIFLMGM